MNPKHNSKRLPLIVFALWLTPVAALNAIGQGTIDLGFRYTGGDAWPLPPADRPLRESFVITDANVFDGDIYFPLGFAGRMTGASIHISADESALGPAWANFAHTGTIVGDGEIPTYFIYSVTSNVTPEERAQLFANNWWVNVTTTDYPVSAIRGQIYAVPEPQTWVLLATGLLVISATAFRNSKGATRKVT